MKPIAGVDFASSSKVNKEKITQISIIIPDKLRNIENDSLLIIIITITKSIKIYNN